MNQVKYYIKGTVKGTIEYNDGTPTEDIPDYCLPEYSEEIGELFTGADEDELAQYIWEGESIYGIVTEIRVGVKIIGGSMYSWTEVTANRELTEAEKKNLLDYLTGQFSDGYGESLEQHGFYTYTDWETYTEWCEEEQEYCENEYECTTWYYFHLWQSKNFKLEFVEGEQEKKPDKVEEEPKKPRCKLIGEDGNIFNLMGIASRTLRRAGMSDKASEMTKKITTEAKDYYHAIRIIMEYVEVE